MHLRKTAHILLPSVLVVVALAAGSDAGKPVTVKG